MPDSLVSIAQGSTVGGFLLNVATIGHNAVFHRATEVPIHLRSAQSLIQKIRDDIRTFSAYLNRKEMTVYTDACNKLCDKVEKQLKEYYQTHMIKRYYMVSGVAITKAIKLNEKCQELYNLVWNASTQAKARIERERGLNFVEQSAEVLRDRESPLDDSGREVLENELDSESPSESSNTDSNIQDSPSLLTAVRSALPSRVGLRVMFPGTGGAPTSFPNFLTAMLLLPTTRNSTPTPGVAFEMTILNHNRRDYITSTPDDSASNE